MPRIDPRALLAEGLRRLEEDGEGLAGGLEGALGGALPAGAGAEVGAYARALAGLVRLDPEFVASTLERAADAAEHLR